MFLIGCETARGTGLLFHRGSGVTSALVDGDEKTFSIIIPTHNNIIMTDRPNALSVSLDYFFFPTEFRSKCFFF